MNDLNQSPQQGPVSRRAFIRKGSGAFVAGTLLANLDVARSAFAASDDTLKIALIGCGGRGTGAAAQALNTPGPTKLVAMADAFGDNLDNSLKQLQAQFAANPEKIAVTPDAKLVGFDGYKQAIAAADVVILATPPGFRPMHFEEAVRQGKHVFMEKPVAVDAPGVRRVLAAAEEAKKKNLKVGVGLQRHHQVGYIETVKRLQDGAIGDILSMRCYWNGNGVWVRGRKPGQSEMDYQMRNWYYFNWLSGDHIVEQHIHNIDVINWIKGSYPVKAQGMGGRQVRTGKDHGEIFDHHFVEFEYADGSRLYSQCRHMQGTWSSVSEHVQGTKGRADLGDGMGWFIRGETSWRHRDQNDPERYQQEHNDLFAAIRNDTPFNEADYGAKSTLSAIMGRMATYTGKMLEWDHVLDSKIDLMPEKFSWDAQPKVLPNSEGYYPVAVPGDSSWVSRIV